MEDYLAHKLRELVSKSRRVPLAAIKQRSVKRFLRSLRNIHWRPDYLLEDTQCKKYMAFSIIYDAESFPNVSSQEIENATRICPFDFFFIIESESLLDIFEERCREKGFGLVLGKAGEVLLIRDAIQPTVPSEKPSYAGHYPRWLATEIEKIKLGNSKFKTAVSDFSKEYLRLKTRKQLDWEKEEKLVKNTIAQMLRSDSRYISGIGSFEILSRFESFWYDIRDHYFHSFHIFLLGLLILNRYEAEFMRYWKNVFPKYYRSLSLEFLWLLTSVFHDVGHAIARLDDLKEDVYGVSTIPPEREITNVWDNPVYRENLKQVISLFRFSLSDKKHRIDWHSEVFGIKQHPLDRIFRESFYDCHGVAGCFRFLVDIFSEARREEDVEEKVFLVNHIYPAALSIALHDRRFREKLLQVDIDKIKLSRFPFTALLAYLDSLQEDRRDKFLCIEAPELLQGFEFNGKVVARISESLARSYPRLGKLKAECRDFLHFVECDGIEFEYPEVLLL